MEASNYFHQYLTAGTALVALVNSGLHYGWPSPSLPQLTSSSSSIQITSEEGYWLIILLLIPPIPMCFLTAFLFDIIGRKNSILLSAVPQFIAWVMITFSKSALTLGVARFLAGISDAIAFPVMSLYIAEIADPSIRGLMGSGMSVSFVLGILLINIIGSYLTISEAAAICALFPVLLLLTFVWMPESPYFLIMRRRYDAARRSLKKLKARDDVEGEFLRLQGAVECQSSDKSSVVELFTRWSNWKLLGVMIIVRNSQQLSGVAAITFYLLSIFQQAGDFVSPLTATIICLSIQCVMNAVGGVFLDRRGRKPIMVFSLAGSALALLVEGTYFYMKEFTTVNTTPYSFVPVVALVGFVILFNMGAQPIPLLIQGEIFPTNVKALAASISEAYFCVLVSIVSTVFQIMRDGVGMYLSFYVFSVCCLVNICFVVWLVPETKGKTLEEIQNK